MRNISTAAFALSIASLSALAQAEPTSQAFVPTELASNSAQGEAGGFFEDQHLTGTTRNWYANDLRRRGSSF